MKLSDQQENHNRSGLFSYLLILTTFFIFLEISFLIQRSDFYFGDFELIANHLSLPGKIIPGIVFFIFVQLLLHFLYTFFIWAMARLTAISLNFSWKKTETLGLWLWFLGIMTVLFANQYYYPNSAFSGLVAVLIPPVLGKIILIALSIIMLCVSALAAKALVLLGLKRKRMLLMGCGVLFAATGLVAQHSVAQDIQDAATSEKPNIIIIGIDSLRPDFLGYFGHVKHTPHLDEFLSQSAVFTDAFTPLARTFPSWVGILTGRYPKHTGVRFNLPIMDHFDWQATLPSMLQQQGYRTVFSTDEVRFSNIDQRFGFDEVITPPIGVNDFLVGDLNDFPFANLLVNTSIGKYLFPHSYANRPAFATYDPNSYLDLLAPALAKSRDKPVFLAVHFCLPHFPYFWGRQRLDDKSFQNYLASVQRVDQQFYDFLTLLKKNKLLEHSIVVVLSDHGEALELQGDRVTEADLFVPGVKNKKKNIPRFYPASTDHEEVNQSAGHGTDVLGLTQYHTVLAFRLFGMTPNQKSFITDEVTLLDIKPTLLAFLRLPVSRNIDGISLKNYILGKKTAQISPRHLFIESDFSPQAIRTVHPETRKLLFAGIEYYRIDPKTTRVNVKADMVKLILSSKQFATIYGNWILALYPQNKTQMMPILVNLDSGQWTNDLQTAFAKRSPSASMLQALKDFYGDEITEIMH